MRRQPFRRVNIADLSRKQLTSQGKIPHDVELEKHPEKSMEGKMWLMGDVSALIHVCLLTLTEVCCTS